jgi:hypothetical protein
MRTGSRRVVEQKIAGLVAVLPRCRLDIFGADILQRPFALDRIRVKFLRLSATELSDPKRYFPFTAMLFMSV